MIQPSVSTKLTVPEVLSDILNKFLMIFNPVTHYQKIDLDVLNELVSAIQDRVMELNQNTGDYYMIQLRVGNNQRNKSVFRGIIGALRYFENTDLVEDSDQNLANIEKYINENIKEIEYEIAKINSRFNTTVYALDEFSTNVAVVRTEKIDELERLVVDCDQTEIMSEELIELNNPEIIIIDI